MHCNSLKKWYLKNRNYKCNWLKMKACLKDDIKYEKTTTIITTDLNRTQITSREEIQDIIDLNVRKHINN